MEVCGGCGVCGGTWWIWCMWRYVVGAIIGRPGIINPPYELYNTAYIHI